MNVTFTRTGLRRYRVSVAGPRIVSSFMEPAAGYDDRLPHDLAHFVVENELGLNGGVFGQLAAGGHAGTFHQMAEPASRKIVKRGKRIAATNRKEASFAERVIYRAWQIWNNQLDGLTPLAGVSTEDFERVCCEFEAVSAVWSRLAVGESMTLVWRGSTGRSQKAGAGRRSKKRKARV